MQALKRLIGVEVLAFITIVGCLIARNSIGADAVPMEEVPVWLKAVMDFVTSIPGVGPVLLSILKWMGVVAAVLTGAATMITGVAMALKKVSAGLGFQAFADKVDALYKKIWPWVAWLSMYNVQKP